MSSYREYHYHSIGKLIAMTFLSVGTYAFYYWYRLWRGQYNQPTLVDRRKSLISAFTYYFSLHNLLVALSERLKKTDKKLALDGYKSPMVFTSLIAATTAIFIILVVMFTITAPGSLRLLFTWLAFAGISAFFMVSLQTNINQAYLIENEKKPEMSKSAYVWYAVFIAFFLLQDAVFFVTPSEQKYQNIETDYSAKLPKELFEEF